MLVTLFVLAALAIGVCICLAQTHKPGPVTQYHVCLDPDVYHPVYLDAWREIDGTWSYEHWGIETGETPENWSTGVRGGFASLGEAVLHSVEARRYPDDPCVECGAGGQSVLRRLPDLMATFHAVTLVLAVLIGVLCIRYALMDWRG